MPANTYYNYTMPQLKAAINTRTVRSILANHEAASQAGPGGIAGGLVGAAGALFGGGDPLNGYSSGVELGAAGDALFGMRTDAINLSNMTAAQPYRPDIALVLSEQPPAGASGYGEGPSGTGPAGLEATIVMQFGEVTVFKGVPPQARAAKLALPPGPSLLLGPGAPAPEAPGPYTVGLGPEGMGGTMRSNRPPLINVLPTDAPMIGAEPAYVLPLGSQGQGGVRLMNRGLRPADLTLNTRSEAQHEFEAFLDWARGEGATEVVPAGERIEMQAHGAASQLRAHYGLPGEHQSMHGLPRSAARDLPGYDPKASLTTFGERDLHAGLDAPWKQAFQQMRRQGQTSITAQEVYDAVANSIDQSPNLSAGMKSSLKLRLSDEMFVEYGLARNQTLRLPYPNIPAGH
jgi:hypothetical protein